MIRVSVKLHGHLYWYADKKKEIEVEVQSKSLEDMCEEIGIPIGEVAMITINQQKKNINEVPQHGDRIDIYPIVGGG